MNYDEALVQGLGYAAGREDASGTGTSVSPAEPHLSGFYAFAQAFAQGWEDYNAQRRHMMTNCRAAYDRWQETGGRSIFGKGELTLSEADRAELDRRRPGAFASTDEFTAYWDLRERMQADAWHELMAGSRTSEFSSLTDD